MPRAAKLKTTELVIDANDVVRDRLPSDPPNPGFLLYDLEGELFFGAALELERAFTRIHHCAGIEAVRHVLLRLKRVRNPDVVSLELFEHFLKRAQNEGTTVWLAGLQPDLIESFRRLDFAVWLPKDRVFPQGFDDDSATLAAIRCIRVELLAEKQNSVKELYYLV